MRSVLTGIKSISVDGLNLIIETNDGNKIIMTFPAPADGKDGFSPIVSLVPKADNTGVTLKIITDEEGNEVQYDILNGKDGKDGIDGVDGQDGKDGTSISNVEIDDDNHLIITLSDNSTIDAGEIKITDSGGGLVQEEFKNFPPEGKENILYLAKDTSKLYYWNGKEYKIIVSEGSDGGGSCECPEIDYVTKEDIDKMFENIPLDPKPDGPGGSCECPDIKYVTKEDIDKMFSDPFIPQPDNGNNNCNCQEVKYVTKEDIDKLFEGAFVPNPDSPDNCSCPDIKYVTKEDIDKLFENIPIMPDPDDPDSNQIQYVTKEDVDKLFEDPFIPTLPDEDETKIQYVTKEDVDKLFNKSDSGNPPDGNTLKLATRQDIDKLFI